MKMEKKTFNCEVLRIRDCVSYLSISRTTIYRLEKEGRFVPRVRLSQNTVGYRKKDLDAYIEARIESTGEEGSNNG